MDASDDDTHENRGIRPVIHATSYIVLFLVATAVAVVCTAPETLLRIESWPHNGQTCGAEIGEWQPKRNPKGLLYSIWLTAPNNARTI